MEILLDLLDRCEKIDIRGWYRAKEELAALREAGKKIAYILKYEFNEGTLTDKETLTALTEWEVANK